MNEEMEYSEHTVVERVANEVEKALFDTLKDWPQDKSLNSVITREMIKINVANFLDETLNKTMLPPSSVAVRTAWECMSKTEKKRWHIVNNLFPEIGQQRRGEIADENRRRYDAAHAELLHERTKNKKNPHKWQVYPDEVEYDRIDTPCWLLTDPRAHLVCDFTLTPLATVKYIKGTYTITKSGEVS